MNEVIIYRGDTPKFLFEILERDGVTPFVLTNCVVYFASIDAFDSAVKPFNVTCTVTDATHGLCEVQLTAAMTTPAGTYIAEVEVYHTPAAVTYVYTAIQFQLTIKEDVRKVPTP